MKAVRATAHKMPNRPMFFDLLIAGVAFFLLGILAAYLYRAFVGAAVIVLVLSLLFGIPILSWTFALLTALAMVTVRIARSLFGGAAS